MLENDKSTVLVNFACPAWPIHYQPDPEHMLLTRVMGMRDQGRHAQRVGGGALIVPLMATA